MKFRHGDRIRRIRDGQPWAPLGFETTVIITDRVRYTAVNGEQMFLMSFQWELVNPVKKLSGFGEWIKQKESRDD